MLEVEEGAYRGNKREKATFGVILSGLTQKYPFVPVDFGKQRLLYYKLSEIIVIAH
jgi:hypothetical protein